jgi:hypothetical protein
VLATATTDSNGDYTMSVAGNTDINVIVVSQMLRDAGQPLPRWNFSVRDAATGDAIDPGTYTYTDGQAFNSNAGTGHDIDIPSGFNSAGAVTGTRASAPFAILDTVYQAVQLVLSAAPNVNFPELVLDWATDNPGGETYFAMGETPQLIVLSADPTEDTDEFDQHVIAHEFGHYIEANFSRADNIGGSHGLGDRLDIRVAFGEGFGYAFGAIVLDDPVSIDTFVDGGTRVSSTFDVDDNPPTPMTRRAAAGAANPRCGRCCGTWSTAVPRRMTRWPWVSSRCGTCSSSSSAPRRPSPAFSVSSRSSRPRIPVARPPSTRWWPRRTPATSPTSGARVKLMSLRDSPPSPLSRYTPTSPSADRQSSCVTSTTPALTTHLEIIVTCASR